MKNKIIIGDLHLKLETKHHLNTLFDNEVKSIYKKEGLSPDNTDLVFLGDIYNDKAIIRSEIQNYFMDFLKYKLQHFNRIIILVGNHDLENLNSEQTALNPLNVISSKIKVIDYKTYDQEEKCLYLPYIHNQQQFKDNMDSFANVEVDYMFCHQAFNGFEYQNNYICNDAIDFENKKIKKVICGHFHKHQERDNIVYLGSAWSQTFGEANEQKKIALLKEGVLTYHNIESLPQHKAYNLAIEDKAIDLDEYVKSIKTDKDITKLNITGKKSIIEPMLKNFKQDMQLQVTYIDNKPDIKISEDMSYFEMFNQWLKLNQNKIPENIDIVSLNKKAKEYINKYA